MIARARIAVDADVDTTIGVRWRSARARFGSTSSWRDLRSFRLSDTANRALIANWDATPSMTTPRRRHSTSILGLEQIGGSNAERKSTAIGSRNGFPNSAAGPFPAEEG
jgi:hypothetical protein